MVINVLAIGDIGNIISTLSKFTKKSKIHIINFPKDGAGVFTYNENVETFENYKVKDHVEKINSIKNNFDIAITMGTGERTAYLADLNYIPFYVIIYIIVYLDMYLIILYRFIFHIKCNFII